MGRPGGFQVERGRVDHCNLPVALLIPQNNRSPQFGAGITEGETILVILMIQHQKVRQVIPVAEPGILVVFLPVLLPAGGLQKVPYRIQSTFMQRPDIRLPEKVVEEVTYRIGSCFECLPVQHLTLRQVA